MRTILAVLGAVTLFTWSLGAGAQLQPPPPMQPPPPGTTWGPQPAQPTPYAPAPYGQPYGPTPYGQPGYGQPTYSATQQQLNAADNAKSFRGLEVAYAKAEAGGEFVGGSGSNGGPMFALGGGARFLTWTLGARVRLVPLTKGGTVLWHIDGEAGFHLPMGAWDPYVSLHGGYFTGGSTNGGEFGGAIGDDYYLSASLSLGLELSADAMFTSPTTLYALDGSLHLGVHFDL